MIITYLRSSSINTLKQCEMKYFGEYVLNIKSEPRQKTVMGSMFHKSMEAIALRKVARQNKKKNFHLPEVGKFPIITETRILIDKSFDYYANRHPEYTWENKHRKELTEWVDSAIIAEQGEFNPNNMNIIEVEKYFDIELTQEWAHYKNHFGEGNLSLKGTIDLIIEHDEHIEVIDWKTGARKNWVTGAEKNFDDLKEDNQLLLYYYVMSQLYDKPITITIFYVNGGGSFTMDFGPDDKVKAEEMIKSTFEYIKSIQKPSLLRPHRFCSFCPLYKTYFDSPKTWPDGNPKDKCYQLKSEIYSIGLAATMKKHTTDLNHVFNYTEGGGKEAK